MRSAAVMASAMASTISKDGLAASRSIEDARDSGLSSESSTPTVGSPLLRQRKAINVAANLARSSSMRTLITVQSATRNGCDHQRAGVMRRVRSVTETPPPRSVDDTGTRELSSPVSQASRNAQSPSLDSGDEASLSIDRNTYYHMLQDIVSIKTMFVNLKRVIQESEGNDSTRAETLNPFDCTAKNGLFYNLNEDGFADVVAASTGIRNSDVTDELADLRRQIVFLQGQVEDRDRCIQVLQFQLWKVQEAHSNGQPCAALTGNLDNVDYSSTCNAATQTEKTRAVSSGFPSLQTFSEEDVLGSSKVCSRIGQVDTTVSFCDLALGYLLLSALNALLFFHLFYVKAIGSVVRL